jgi:hypothetical protein
MYRLPQLLGLLVSCTGALLAVTPAAATSSFNISHTTIEPGLTLQVTFSPLGGDNRLTAVGIACGDAGWVVPPVTSFYQEGDRLTLDAPYNGPARENCRVYMYDTHSTRDYASNQTFTIPASNTAVPSAAPSMQTSHPNLFDFSLDETQHMSAGQTATFNVAAPPDACSIVTYQHCLEYPTKLLRTDIDLQSVRANLLP